MCREPNPGTDVLPHAEVRFRVYNPGCRAQNGVGSGCSPPWSLCRTTGSTRGACKIGGWASSALLLAPGLAGDRAPSTGASQLPWDLGSPDQTWTSARSANTPAKYLLRSVPAYVERSPIKTSCTKNTIDMFALEEIGIWLTVLIRDSWLQPRNNNKELERMPTAHPALPSPSSYLHSASSVLTFPAAAPFCSDEKAALTP